MNRNERIQARLGELPLLAVLLVGDSSSCSLCGAGANPAEERHTTVIGYGVTDEQGCQARFVAIGALNRYEGDEEAMHSIRPDLPFVRISDAEAYRLALS
jgi:hypothetical protein